MGEENIAYLSVYYGFQDPDNQQYLAYEGEVTVTEANDSRVKGTFNFTAKEIDFDYIWYVTEGFFEIEY